MARMFPKHTHAPTKSKAEVNIYMELQKQLPDSYTVIHSVPWLKSAAKMFVEDGHKRHIPTGEIDFLILHAELGVLAIEVKGGIYKYTDHSFFSVSLNEPKNVIGQIRRNSHGLSRSLGEFSHLRFKFGYAVMFPDSSFLNKSLPPAMQDGMLKKSETIVIGKEHIPILGERISNLMSFWKSTLNTDSLGEKNIAEIVNLICPEMDFSPTWKTRILFDKKMWLSLTAEQNQCLERFEKAKKIVVRGWPGTGKTLLAIETVKRLAAKKKKILVITFNIRIAAHIRNQLLDQGTSVRVFHFHELCRNICATTGDIFKFSDDFDYSITLNSGNEKKYFDNYDAIVIDEGQTLAKEWHSSFSNFFRDKQSLIFCDDTQVFSFEKGKSTTSRVICDIFDVEEPFVLTHCLRSPKAINETLQKISPPDFQVQCPRPFEDDSFKEIVTDDPRKELVKQLHLLLNEQGLVADDIVIIYPYWDTENLFEEGDPFNEILRTNAATYRGLESPVVILFANQTLSGDGSILFSAFSRATSKVIAIYGVGSFAYFPKQWTYLEDVANRFKDDINTIRISQSISECFEKNYRTATQLKVTTADIYWEDNWKTWIVQFHQINPAGKFWVDYLSTLDWPVLYWTKHQDQNAHLRYGNQYISENGEGGGLYRFMSCKECDGITPHKIELYSAICGLCDDTSPFDSPVSPSAIQIEEVEFFDSVITRNVRGERIFNKELPISLVAMGIAMLAVEKGHAKFSQILTDGGRMTHRAAYSIISAKAAIKYPKPLELNELVKFYYERYEYLAKNGVAMKSWHSAVATAFGVQIKTKRLVKVVGGANRFAATNSFKDDEDCSK